MDPRIRQYVELDPNHPGIADARLRESGVSVWALIGYLPAVEGNLGQAAEDYVVSLEEIEAAVAFYHEHRVVIDARIAANNVELDDMLRAA